MSDATSKHLGYTLVPRWVRGFPGRYLSCSVSRSGILHVWQTPGGQVVTRCERYGATVRVWNWKVATYFDGAESEVNRCELAFAVDGAE
jgi:hypothetical protein